MCWPRRVRLSPHAVTHRAGFAPELRIPQGADEADGDSLRRIIADQIGCGADWIKVYADTLDARKIPSPTYSEEELRLLVETARLSVAARWRPMQQRRKGCVTRRRRNDRTRKRRRHRGVSAYGKNGVALCPTLAADEAMSKYRGWKMGKPEPIALKSSGSSQGAGGGRDHRQWQRHGCVRPRRRHQGTGVARQFGMKPSEAL